MKYIIILLFVHQCITFDIPKSACKTDLTIDNNHYNVTETYNVGDVYPTDAHYDPYGNLFFVGYGRNYKGYFFNIKVIKQNSTEAQNITGLPEGESYSIAVDKKNAKEEIVFIASETLTYIHENDTGPLKLVKNIPGKVTAISFDYSGNFILGTYGKIFKYTANINVCYHRKT
ncbi:unnamed protein product [Euphydryas editha]|uniref:Ommochrome-binding protein-like n=1 Tax=Euphydryas editha TaxID=104508 RepID=A0AAU9VAL7_EUPED|nr:unnamed protein product [Euphydryas editha]